MTSKLVFSAILLSSVLLHLPVAAAEQAEIEADRLSFDQSGDVALADGNVTIHYEGNVMDADQVEWNQPNDIIDALGNIKVVMPDGTVIYSDKAHLKNRMQDGTFEPLRVELPDDAHATAPFGERIGGTKMQLRQAKYTSCKPCADPNKAPLWRMSSRDTTIDDTAQTVTYWHNTLDLYGMPVFYLPYFQHPTPDVKKKSGFLPPMIGQDGRLGANIVAPYFWNIAPNYDATITPKITTDEGVILTVDWRHLTPNGHYDVTLIGNEPDDALATIDGDNSFRGGVIAKGDFAFDAWSMKFDILEPTDDLFFDRYRINDETTLTSNVQLKTRYDRGDITLDMYSYRYVEENFSYSTVHKALPLITHRHKFDIEPLGGKLSMTNQVVHSIRDFGADLTEIRSSLAWEKEHVDLNGFVWSFSNQTQLDGFSYKTKAADSYRQLTRDETYASNVTAIGVDYPLIKFGETATQRLTPKMQLIGAANDRNFRSQFLRSGASYDLDTAYLFNVNTPGLETSRANYGVAYELDHNNGMRAELFAGQSYNLDINALAAATGYGDNESNVVTQAKFNYGPLDLQSNLRLDQNGGTILRNQSRIGLAFARARLSTHYSFYERGQIGDRLEEVSYYGEYHVTDRWSLVGSRRENLRSGRAVNQALALRYGDECTLFEIKYSKDNAQIGNLKPSSSINFLFTLRTFGNSNWK